jgi:hypothetical protein
MSKPPIIASTPKATPPSPALIPTAPQTEALVEIITALKLGAMGSVAVQAMIDSLMTSLDTNQHYVFSYRTHDGQAGCGTALNAINRAVENRMHYRLSAVQGRCPVCGKVT